MKITTKFAYTGLILSILCVHPSLANAKEKPVNVSSLKSCESESNDSKDLLCVNSKFDTRYGQLVFVSGLDNPSGDNSIYFKGKEIKNFGGIIDVAETNIFHFKDSDVVFISFQSEAHYVPVNYFFLRITSDAKVKISNFLDEGNQKYGEYESYSNLEHPKLKQEGDTIIVDLGKNSQGSQEIATYQNDHISVKITKSKKGKLLAYEAACKDTYEHMYHSDNSGDSQILRCQTQSYDEMSDAAMHSGYLLNDNYFKIVQYSCQNHKMINYQTFKKYVCTGK